MADEMSERLRCFARSMRKEPTKAENMLWQMLRGRKLEGLKFKRQEPMVDNTARVSRILNAIATSGRKVTGC